MELRYENPLNRNFHWLSSFNNRFDETARNGRSLKPAADVVEEKDRYRFYFEMPGLKHESVDVRVENGALRIAAESRRPEWPADARMHVAERSYGSVKRAFQLPEDAGHDQIHAAYKDGVLEVVIEKKVESRPVKIQVN